MRKIALHLILVSLQAFSQESPLAPETTLETFWRDFSSPVTTRAWIPLAIGTGSTAFFWTYRQDIGDKLQSNWSRRRPFGKTASFGDFMGQLVPNAAYVIGMSIDGWGYNNPKSKRRAILMLKAAVYASAWTTGLKYVFRQQRPNKSDKKSFPSGHATTAFSFASVVGAEHEWYWGVGAYSLATFVALSRINDNMHRLHDLTAGAAIGISYGLGLYYRMHQENSNKEAQNVYQVLPTEGLDGAVLTFTREF